MALPLEVISNKAQYVLVCNTEDCKKSCQFYCNDFDQQTCEHIETNTRIIQIPRTTKWSLTINENHFSMILVEIDLCLYQLQEIQTSGKNEGYHTVTKDGDLIYDMPNRNHKAINWITRDNTITNLSKQVTGYHSAYTPSTSTRT